MQPQQPVPGTGDPNTIPASPTTPTAPSMTNPAGSIPDPTVQPAPAMPGTVSNPTQPTSPMDPAAPTTIDPTMQTTAPSMSPQPVQETKSGGSGKKIILLVLGILFLIGAAAAVYFFVIKKQSSEPMTVDTIPTPTPIPDQNLIEKEIGETPEEQEVIDIEDVSVDEEFNTIDQDLQQL